MTGGGPAETGGLRVPELSCLIATEPRSGSWLLSAGLHETELVGQPEEYFRPDMTRLWSADWGIEPRAPYDEYIAHALDWSTGDNGVFSAKLHWYQFHWFVHMLRSLHGGDVPGDRVPRDGWCRTDPLEDAELVASWIPNPRWVHLWRRDTARQAVSYFRAGQTDIWFVVEDDGYHPVEDGRPIEPDFGAIKYLEALVVGHEQRWREFFESSGVPCLDVAYEDLAADYRGTIGGILEWLGVGSAADAAGLEPRLVKQADTRSEQWLEQYLLVRDDVEERPPSSNHVPPPRTAAD